jgi:hypothetical protein
MFYELSVGHTLAYALKRGCIPRDALKLGFLTPKEQSDFHAKCDELAVLTSEAILAQNHQAAVADRTGEAA